MLMLFPSPETIKKLEGLVKKLKEKKVETIEKDDNYTESFYNLYTELAG